ncbi:MAG: hypothetical protein ABIV94_08780 [Acidimicrobiales bacterium]
MKTTTTYRTAGLHASATASRSWSLAASSTRTSASIAEAGVTKATVATNPMFVGQDLTFGGKPNHRRRWLSEPSP